MKRIGSITRTPGCLLCGKHLGRSERGEREKGEMGQRRRELVIAERPSFAWMALCEQDAINSGVCLLTTVVRRTCPVAKLHGSCTSRRTRLLILFHTYYGFISFH